jgi:large subunit ribosomal protein L10
MSQVALKKVNIVEETVELLNRYDVIAASDLYKVGSIMLQDLRKQLRGDLDIRCIKNTLMRISLEKAGKKNWESFMDAIPGQNLFIFTNGNPFKLAMRLDRNKVKVFSKTGDAASDEIIIPSGNTGLAPGPIISNFGTLGIRTRIESGNIWVNQDSGPASKDRDKSIRDGFNDKSSIREGQYTS